MTHATAEDFNEWKVGNPKSPFLILCFSLWFSFFVTDVIEQGERYPVLWVIRVDAKNLAFQPTDKDPREPSQGAKSGFLQLSW